MRPAALRGHPSGPGHRRGLPPEDILGSGGRCFVAVRAGGAACLDVVEYAVVPRLTSRREFAADVRVGHEQIEAVSDTGPLMKVGRPPDRQIAWANAVVSSRKGSLAPVRISG